VKRKDTQTKLHRGTNDTEPDSYIHRMSCLFNHHSWHRIQWM